MKKAGWATLIVLVFLIPGTLFLGTHLHGRWYYLTATLVVTEAMLPFFLLFESRKPQARELVLLAVLCALAVVSRVAVVLPSLKPTLAVIMLVGMAMGAQSGFLCGAVTALASNFFFSQGPWTPWQMLAYGLAGLLAGLVWYGRRQPRPWLSAVFCFLVTVTVVGPVLDLCSVFTLGGSPTKKYVLAALAAGAPHNLKNGAAGAAVMLVFSKPFLAKLNRLKIKYGLLEAAAPVKEATGLKDGKDRNFGEEGRAD